MRICRNRPSRQTGAEIALTLSHLAKIEYYFE